MVSSLVEHSLKLWLTNPTQTEKALEHKQCQLSLKLYITTIEDQTLVKISLGVYSGMTTTQSLLHYREQREVRLIEIRTYTHGSLQRRREQREFRTVFERTVCRVEWNRSRFIFSERFEVIGMM